MRVVIFLIIIFRYSLTLAYYYYLKGHGTFEIRAVLFDDIKLVSFQNLRPLRKSTEISNQRERKEK